VGSRYWILTAFHSAEIAEPSLCAEQYLPVFAIVAVHARFLTYTRTLTNLLEETSEEQKVLLVYPRASLYAAFTPMQQAEYNKTRAVLSECEAMLARLQIGYDVVDENEILSASAQKKELKITSPAGKGAYSVVIMPRINIVFSKTMHMVQQALAKEISFLWIGSLPVGTVEEGLVPTMRKNAEELQKKHPEHMKFFETPSAAEPYLREACRSNIRCFSSEKILENVSVAQRAGKHKYYIFLNDSGVAERHVNVQLDSKEKLYMADCDMQEIYNSPARRKMKTPLISARPSAPPGMYYHGHGEKCSYRQGQHVRNRFRSRTEIPYSLPEQMDV